MWNELEEARDVQQKLKRAQRMGQADQVDLEYAERRKKEMEEVMRQDEESGGGWWRTLLPWNFAMDTYRDWQNFRGGGKDGSAGVAPGAG